MKNLFIYFIATSIFLTVISCYDECHDVNYADQYLDPVSESFQSWQSVETFIYKDSMQQEFRYDLTTSIEYLLDSRTTGYCEDTTRLITFETEYFLKRYTSEEKSAIAFAHFVDFVESEPNLEERRLVDKLFLSVYNDNIPGPTPLSRIVLMTSSKESPYSSMGYNHSTTIFHARLEIMNNEFYNVYEQKNGTLKIYYTKQEGVISFTDIYGRRLVLDRTE